MTTNAGNRPMMVLDQILLDNNEFRYRDRATGREYTALEARSLNVPSRIEYLRGRR